MPYKDIKGRRLVKFIQFGDDCRTCKTWDGDACAVVIYNCLYLLFFFRQSETNKNLFIM